MRRPVVLLDVDGPLTTGFFTRACEELQPEGIYVKPHQLKKWAFFEGVGATPEIERRVRDRLQRPGVATSFEPSPGAQLFLTGLREWADVFAVTSPLDGSPTWAYERECWLNERLGFDGRHVISTRDKQPVRGDAFVDDKYDHIIEWQAAWPAGLAVLWGQPHNAGDPWAGPKACDYHELTGWLGVLRP